METGNWFLIPWLSRHARPSTSFQGLPVDKMASIFDQYELAAGSAADSLNPFLEDDVAEPVSYE